MSARCAFAFRLIRPFLWLRVFAARQLTLVDAWQIVQTIRVDAVLHRSRIFAKWEKSTQEKLIDSRNR
jgi:hypothetical protein